MVPRVLATVLPSLRFILNGPALPHFIADPTARRYLRSKQPFVIRRRDDGLTVPDDWQALTVRTFTRCRDIERALATDAPSIAAADAILYDNEAWQFTPPEEQREPARFTETAARLVHERGLHFIAAPAVDLTRVLAPGPERRYDAYLRLELAASAARRADTYVVQAQGSQSALARFEPFVRRAAAQARAANPDVLVVAGISTNPGGQRTPPATVLRAIEATRDAVDGYWLNVPHPGPYAPRCDEFRPDVALAVFAALAQS